MCFVLLLNLCFAIEPLCCNMDGLSTLARSGCLFYPSMVLTRSQCKSTVSGVPSKRWRANVLQPATKHLRGRLKIKRTRETQESVMKSGERVLKKPSGNTEKDDNSCIWEYLGRHVPREPVEPWWERPEDTPPEFLPKSIKPPCKKRGRIQ